MENPSYMGAIQAFDSYQAEYVIVPMDDDGMRSEELDATCGATRQVHLRPAQLPEPEWPTMSTARRKTLVETAQKHGVPIVEDDPYGELRFEGALRACARCGRRAWFTSGRSPRSLAPGFRLGWLVSPPELYDEIVFGKQPVDRTPRPAARWRPTRSAAARRPVPRAAHREDPGCLSRAPRRDGPRDGGALPEGCTWTRAQGGLFVWAEVPPSIDTRELLAEALEENVAFVPGQSFHPDRGGWHNTMRLNFSNVTRPHRGGSPGPAARSSADSRTPTRRPAKDRRQPVTASRQQRAVSRRRTSGTAALPAVVPLALACGSNA